MLAAIFPFSLTGPQFLAFFAILASASLLGWRLLLRLLESGPPPQLDLHDPYQIAFLRGGAQEAVMVATFSLVDRGLLRYDGVQAVAASAAAEDLARRVLEKHLIRHFDRPMGLESLERSSLPERAEAQYAHRLERHGLLPDLVMRRWRRVGLAVVVGLPLAVAVTRVAQTLMAGRGNLFFLVCEAALALYLTYRFARPRLTARGRATLDDLRSLFSRLRQRASGIRPGGATADAVMLAAVFGLDALPAATFPLAQGMRRKGSGSGSGDSGGGGGCGSSGGSCGGGGGGGCGGGGCGS